MPTSRRKLLFVHVPVSLAIGLALVVIELQAHGLSGSVISGLSSGALFIAAIAVLLAERSRKVTREQLDRSRKMWSRTHSAVVGFALAVGGTLVALGRLISPSASAGAFLMTLLGVAFAGTGAVIGMLAIRRPELWDS